MRFLLGLLVALVALVALPIHTDCAAIGKSHAGSDAQPVERAYGLDMGKPGRQKSRQQKASVASRIKKFLEELSLAVSYVEHHTVSGGRAAQISAILSELSALGMHTTVPASITRTTSPTSTSSSSKSSSSTSSKVSSTKAPTSSSASSSTKATSTKAATSSSSSSSKSSSSSSTKTSSSSSSTPSSSSTTSTRVTPVPLNSATSTGEAAATDTSSSSSTKKSSSSPSSSTKASSSSTSTKASSSSSSSTKASSSSSSSSASTVSATTTNAAVVPATTAASTTATTFTSTKTTSSATSTTKSLVSSTASAVQEVLDYHNAKRALHTGTPAMVWNDTLAAYAASYGSGCAFKHSGGPYGENIAAGSPFKSWSTETLFNLWYAEGKGYDYSGGVYIEAAGHFTQAVWKSSTQLGCAEITCDASLLGLSTKVGTSSAYLVCEYYPAGNVYGKYTANVLYADDQ